MGTLIDLDTHRRARRPPDPVGVPSDRPVRLYFDVVSPFTYLAAERVDRMFAGASWHAVNPGVSAARTWSPDARRRAEARATLLGMPLVWPDEREVPRAHEPAHGLAARRASAFAVSRGRGAPFVTVAGRLAFCGGYDLDDPDVLADAAIAARLCPDECLAASTDPAWDASLVQAAARVAGLGALPVLECGNRVFAGEHRVVEALAATVALAH